MKTFFKTITFIFISLLSISCVSSKNQEGDSIAIMSFNIWRDGKAGKQPLSQTAEVIKKAKVDVVGLQEAKAGTVKKLAEMLGWYHSGTILSRLKILDSNIRSGVKVQLSSGQEAFVFNVHLSHAPYQPYQLLNIPYGKYPFIKTEKEAIAFAKKARGWQVEALLKTIKDSTAKNSPIFITGDFNEPSHLDWTEAAAKKGVHPIKVVYPNSLSLTQAGFNDAYRTVYSDEIKKPGYTWTPLTKVDNPKDHHDRIDFVYFRGGTVQIKSAEIVGENKQNADIVVSPYPSDHRAVVARFSIEK